MRADDDPAAAAATADRPATLPPGPPRDTTEGSGAPARNITPAEEAAEAARRTEGGRAVGREMGVPGAVGTLAKLHQDNRMEIEMAMMARERAHAPEVKDFAETLIADHSAADKQVLALARRKQVDEPQLRASADAAELPEDQIEQRATMRRLDEARGDAFDRAFASVVLYEHRRGLAMVRQARDVTDDPQLEALLASLQPTLERHKRRAERIALDTTPVFQ